MPCPNEDSIIAYLGGELDSIEEGELLEHMKCCEQCWQIARELLLIQHGLGEIARENPCPSREEVLAFAEGQLDPSREAGFQEHVTGCLACQIIVQNLEALDGEAAHEVLEGLKARARTGALAVVESFLPRTRRFFERLWDRAEEVSGELFTGKEAEYDAIAVREQVAGALGAGAVEPETVMALITVLSALTVANEMAHGGIENTEAALRTFIEDRARRLGAGEGLVKTLCESFPPVFLTP